MYCKSSNDFAERFTSSIIHLPHNKYLSLSSEDADLYRSAMNEDELINFLGQVEFSLHPTP
jgi:hypothetical protein